LGCEEITQQAIAKKKEITRNPEGSFITLSNEFHVLNP
jgi:hypothetical protein